jgi:transcription factor C subunit 7
MRGKASSSNDAILDSRLCIRVESGLSEWYGRAHFEHPTSAPLSDLSALFADLDANYASCPAPQRHGESLPQLYERVASCIQAIIARSDKEGKKAILICTHAAVVIALGRILTGKVPEDAGVEDFRAFTCGLSIYRRQGGDDDRSAATSIAAAIGDNVQKSADTRNMMQAVDRPALYSRGPEKHALEQPLQSCGFGLPSHWTCEANSDCSFLGGGEERGW